MKNVLKNHLKLDKILFFLLTFFFFSCNNEKQEIEKKQETKVVLKQVDSLDEPKVEKSQIDESKYLTQKELFEYVKTAKIIKPNTNLIPPFDTLKYDKIIAYDFDGGAMMIDPYEAIVNNKDKGFARVIEKQQFLTQIQANKILYTLTQNKFYGDQTAACFIPHFALAFYKGNKIVNEIDICLMCNYLLTDISIPNITSGKLKGRFSTPGFTKTTKDAISDLCKELKFYSGRKDTKMKSGN